MNLTVHWMPLVCWAVYLTLMPPGGRTLKVRNQIKEIINKHYADIIGKGKTFKSTKISVLF